MRYARALALSLLAVVLSAPPSSAVGPGDFEEAATSPESTGTFGSAVIATGATDFNLDGDRDLAVANRDGSVPILLGQGNGDFDPAPNSPQAGPDTANGLVSEDFNGDGKPDLAVVGGIFMGAELKILLGLGDGDFTQPVSSPYGAGFAPMGVAAGRFDANSTIDLAVTDHKFGQLYIFLGDGAGNFTGVPPIAVGATPWPIAVADFNGDGERDLAVASELAGTVTIMLGDGAGGFTAAPSSPEAAGTEVHGIAAVNLNHDGKVDLAVPSAVNNNVDILLGDGTGDFAPAPSSPEAAGSGANAVVATDLSRDGVIDIATPNVTSDGVSILLGNGTGDFTEAGTSPEAAGTGPNSIAGGDLNGDGVPDLAVLNQDSSDVTILLNTSPPPPSPPKPPEPSPPPPGEPPPGEAPPADTCRHQVATIAGSSGDDSITGTPGDDVIFALAGTDTVFGGPGNDLICLGDGDDLGRGGKGNDVVIGNRGDDRLLGNKGIDKLFGRREDDSLIGGQGSDLCGGGRGTDTKQGCEA
jgi:Ca2+-binding RTX toxin-like protein